MIPKTVDENSLTLSQNKPSLFLKYSSQAFVTVMISKVYINNIYFP